MEIIACMYKILCTVLFATWIALIAENHIDD
jgi:hypothetical protein